MQTLATLTILVSWMRALQILVKQSGDNEKKHTIMPTFSSKSNQTCHSARKRTKKTYTMLVKADVKVFRKWLKQVRHYHVISSQSAGSKTDISFYSTEEKDKSKSAMQRPGGCRRLHKVAECSGDSRLYLNKVPQPRSIIPKGLLTHLSSEG